MYRRYDVIAKMREKEIIDFSESEINRVFCECVSPSACKRAVNKMLADGLSLQEIYASRWAA